jgi:hypothetical protein
MQTYDIRHYENYATIVIILVTDQSNCLITQRVQTIDGLGDSLESKSVGFAGCPEEWRY